MKIIAGTYKGRNFYMPEGIRPTQNLVRKALFDLLGEDLPGAAFLDLFAGSGAVGLEAVSRGAGKVTFVERSERFCEIIRENLDLLEVPLLGEDRRQVYELIESDGFAAVKGFARQGRRFDIVFADPPYEVGLAKKILKTLGAYDIVSPNCVVVIQHEKREILPEIQGNLLRSGQRKYGSTVLSIYKSSLFEILNG
ncbi:MAG: 16S rRNA (guanine(966)-N(2))-methyltransferase RsmD [Candidatus Omnitrophica bacterium]|nr:16S rRNA (guanine(966)-N(2))-methyltransferase RsmD [Candidatus Omnitrophota bacterium]